MVDQSAKIVPGRQKAVIPKVKSGQDLLIDPPHLLADADDGRAVQSVEPAVEPEPAPTLEAIGAPAVDLSKPEMEALATAPQDTAADLHSIALAKTAGTDAPNPTPPSEPEKAEGVMGLGSSEAVAQADASTPEASVSAEPETAGAAPGTPEHSQPAQADPAQNTPHEGQS